MTDSRKDHVEFGNITRSFMTLRAQYLCRCSDSTAERVCSGVQGQELLSALGRFIKELTANAGITKEVIEESKTPGGMLERRQQEHIGAHTCTQINLRKVKSQFQSSSMF